VAISSRDRRSVALTWPARCWQCGLSPPYSRPQRAAHSLGPQQHAGTFNLPDRKTQGLEPTAGTFNFPTAALCAKSRPRSHPTAAVGPHLQLARPPPSVLRAAAGTFNFPTLALSSRDFPTGDLGSFQPAGLGAG
jgi:hypothetical protein